MTRRYYVISDLHLEHQKMYQFTWEDGTPARPNPFTKQFFSSMEEHDNFLIAQWNKKVSRDDTVYLLGDVCIHPRGLWKLGQLSGRKILVPGNHDIFPIKDYLPYFSDIRGYIVKNNIIYSHIPINVESMNRYSMNVHGHTHNFRIKNSVIEADNLRYYPVSVEHTIDYAPIAIDEIHSFKDKYKLERN